MGVIKGLAFFFFVLLPGLVLFAVIAGGGAWVLLNAADTGVTRGLEFVGVNHSDTDVVIKTVIVAIFVYLVAIALGRDFKRL